MHIVVTGGAGFIGSHLINRLLNEGHTITCVDNLLTGCESNIRPFLKSKRFRFIKKDIIDINFLDFDIHIDQIYNLACPASPVKYQSDPIHTIKTNTIGIINILEIAKNFDARILQASTSEVYGDPLIKKQSEDYLGNVNTIGKRACYDEGKRIAETLFSDYNRLYNTDVRIARIFNTYGENMQSDDGRVVTNFIHQAMTGKPLTVYGKGLQTRSFCYISDLIEGLVRLMNVDLEFCYPVNLGNPEEVSIMDVAETILDLTNSSSVISFNDLPEDDPKQRNPDISRAESLLNWKPLVSLDEGIRNILRSLK